MPSDPIPAAGTLTTDDGRPGEIPRGRHHDCLYTAHTARKQHQCLHECGDPIEPGTRYLRSALPPWTDPNESARWWYGAVHGLSFYDCPRYANRGVRHV